MKNLPLHRDYPQYGVYSLRRRKKILKTGNKSFNVVEQK